jgi:enoyl-CoA hydratase/carnithine racemase
VLASSKELLTEAPFNPLATQLDLERTHFLKNLYHPNAGTGIAAFLEKRKPQYE